MQQKVAFCCSTKDLSLIVVDHTSFVWLYESGLLLTVVCDQVTQIK